MANGIIPTPNLEQDRQHLNHFHTFRHHRTGVLVWGLVLPAYLPPIAGAVLAFIFDWRLSGVAELIAGTAVLAGFLFALMIFVFQLRLQITHDPRVQERLNLPRLVDELFQNVLYSALVSLAFTLAVIVSTVTAPVPAVGPIRLELWPSMIVVALGAHLIGLLYVVIQRTQAAYRELTTDTVE
jgi:hydrogenase-4 membrane subunit HyfE